MSKIDEIELLKMGNAQVLDRMKNTVPHNDSDNCTLKHREIVDGALIPFAERSFALHEMQFKKSNGDKTITELPTPWGKPIKIDSATLLRIIAILCLFGIIYILITDKEERRQVRNDLLNYRKSIVEKSNNSNTETRMQ